MHPSSFEIAAPDDVTSVLVSFDGVNWTPVGKMRPERGGNLLQVAHCLMVIILSMSGRRIGRGPANSTLGFTVDTQIDGLKRRDAGL